jgi:hypothetical protein
MALLTDGRGMWTNALQRAGLAGRPDGRYAAPWTRVWIDRASCR